MWILQPVFSANKSCGLYRNLFGNSSQAGAAAALHSLPDWAFDSFAIGGGTPLLLTVPQLEYLLDTAVLFGVYPSHTFTSVETSPEYADPARLESY